MKIPTHTRLSQIKAYLGPLLKTMGLRPRLNWADNGMPYIAFDGVRPHTMSPVEIWVLAPQSTGWVDCLLVRHKVKIYEFGETGWRYFEGPGGDVSEELTGDASHSLARIEAAVRAGGIVYGKGHPLQILQRDLALIFEEIESFVGDQNTLQCERDGNAETVKFQDDFENDWSISVENDTAVITLNGKTIDTFPSCEHSTIADSISERLYGFEIAYGR